MKINFLLLFAVLVNVMAMPVNGQNESIKIRMKDVVVRDLLKEVESKTSYRFFFSDNYADIYKTISIDVETNDITELLTEVFKKSTVTFKVLDNYAVVITPVKTLQGISVTGTLTDNGMPMPGVNIVVKGTLNGAVSDINGKYTITVPDRNAVLVFSFIGYASIEHVVGDKQIIDVELQEDNKQIEEVVVVAYGTQKVRQLTGSMSRLNTDELIDMPVSNIGQKMQGKFSGVQIYQNSGNPNGGLSYRIRGQASISGGNSPLVVIDGFPSITGLDALSPDEIESISILKDAASTALYGSRAANGVIMVTTKRAREGKTNIEFSANYGWEVVPKKGRPDVMNAQEFAQFKKEYYEDKQKYEPNPDGTPIVVPPCYENPEQVQDGTDWYDILMQTANIQNYNLSLSTGTTKVKSSVNLNYNKQEGVMINTFAERISARANNLFDATNWLKFGLNVGGSYRQSQIPPGIGEDRAILGSSFLMDPQLKYRNDDGTYPISFSQPGMFGNANYYLVLMERENPSKQLNALANAFAEVEILKGLKYKFSANVDIANQNIQRWTPSYVQGGMFSPPPGKASGEYYSNNYLTWLLENTLTYNTVIANDHHIDALVGYTTQKASQDNAKILSTDYPDDEIGWFNTAVTKTGSSDANDWFQWSVVSYLARLNYNYKERYLLSATFRRDGCSRFGAYSKWANFPSISLGWIVSDEAFMENVRQLSYLKMRASYGKTGNNNIGNYSYIAQVVNTNYVMNGAVTNGKSLNGIGNNDLTWETTVQYDLGLDIGLFNDRIFLVYDYYWKATDGLLYRIDIPWQSGFENIQSNIGEFRFWGHEFNLETKNFVGEFKWNTNFNITFNRNKVIKLGTNDTPLGGNANQMDYHRVEVGKPLGYFMGYIFDGVYMTQAEYEAGPKHSASTVGTARMKDIAGGPNGEPDGIIDMSDRTMIGNPNPKFLYGMTNEFSYKNFDLSIVIAGSYGGDVMDGTYEWTENLDGVFNVRKEVAERWRSIENPGKGNIPRTLSNTTELFRFNNTRWVFDGSYLMVKNLTLGYTFPLSSNKYFKSLRVYGSAQNLLTLTNYPGMNPEVNAYGSSGWQQGLDYSSYPIARIYSVGLNVKF